VLRRLLYQRRYAAQLAAVIRGNHGRLPSTSISTVTCRMTAPELKPDEPDWLAPPLALPPLVRDGTSRLAGCVPVSDIEWRLAEVLLEDEAVFQSGQRWGRNPRIEAVSFLSRPLLSRLADPGDSRSRVQISAPRLLKAGPLV